MKWIQALNTCLKIAGILIAIGIFLSPIPWTANADQSKGEALYQYHCAQCHGKNGDGKGINATEDLPTQPKDFISPKNLPVFSDEQILNTIKHGGPKEQLSFIMPAWGEMLSDEQIDLLRIRLREICNCKYDPEAAAKAAIEN